MARGAAGDGSVVKFTWNLGFFRDPATEKSAFGSSLRRPNSPRERRYRHTVEVRGLLEASTAPACILCEVQVLLQAMVDVRYRMHE